MDGKRELIVVIIIALGSFLLLFYTVNRFAVGRAVDVLPGDCELQGCHSARITLDLSQTPFAYQPVTLDPRDEISIQNYEAQPLDGNLWIVVQREETFFTPGETSVNPNTPSRIHTYTKFMDYRIITNKNPISIPPGASLDLRQAVDDAQLLMGKGTYRMVAGLYTGGLPVLDAAGSPLVARFLFTI